MKIKGSSNKSLFERSLVDREVELRIQRRREREELCKSLEVDEDFLIGVGMLRRSDDEWVASKIRDLRLENAAESISGRYQEPDEQRVLYQQRYVKVLRDCSPHVFEELRKFSPHFESLFGKMVSNDDIIQVSKRIEDFANLFWNDTTNPLREFPLTTSVCRIPANFNWKRYKVLIFYSRLLFDIDAKRVDKSGELSKDVATWFEENRNGPATYDWFEKSKEAATRLQTTITRHFKVGEIEDTELLRHFFELHCGLYLWMERHEFECDFILMAAYIFLGQFSLDPDLKTSDLRIFPRTFPRRLQGPDFDFKTEGWWANSEPPDKYKERVLKMCAERLDEYFHSSYFYLGLAEKRKVTKPKDPEFEGLYWLVAWNEEATLRQIAKWFNRSTYTIADQLEELSKNGLPKRIGTPGRRPSKPGIEDRLFEIKRLFLAGRQSA